MWGELASGWVGLLGGLGWLHRLGCLLDGRIGDGVDRRWGRAARRPGWLGLCDGAEWIATLGRRLSPPVVVYIGRTTCSL